LVSSVPNCTRGLKPRMSADTKPRGDGFAISRSMRVAASSVLAPTVMLSAIRRSAPSVSVRSVPTVGRPVVR
jgi:hypothetical protein